MDARAEVLAAARRRADALAAGDASGLTAVLHAAFGWVSHTGEHFDRAGYLAANTGGRTRWRAQDLGAPEVTVVADAAVLRTVVTDTVDTVDGPRSLRMPMTQLWVRGDGGWRCLAGHAGPLLAAEPVAGE